MTVKNMRPSTDVFDLLIQVETLEDVTSLHAAETLLQEREVGWDIQENGAQGEISFMLSDNEEVAFYDPSSSTLVIY